MNKLERLGIGMSLVCAVHCIAAPLLISVLPLLGHRLSEAHWLEAVLIGIAAIFGCFTLGLGFRRHRRALPLAMFTLGLLVIASHEVLPQGATTVASAGGTLLLAAAQLVNRRWPVRCCSEHP